MKRAAGRRSVGSVVVRRAPGRPSHAGTTAWILGDQLSHANPALDGADRVLLVESRAKLGSGHWHRQKLHLVLSAMRHFAAELEAKGIEVDYRRARTLATGLRSHVREHRPEAVRLLRPHSRAGVASLGGLDRVEVVEETLFLTSPAAVRGVGRRPPAAADGGLLPLAAPAPRTS